MRELGFCKEKVLMIFYFYKHKTKKKKTSEMFAARPSNKARGLSHVPSSTPLFCDGPAITTFLSVEAPSKSIVNENRYDEHFATINTQNYPITTDYIFLISTDFIFFFFFLGTSCVNSSYQWVKIDYFSITDHVSFEYLRVRQPKR